MPNWKKVVVSGSSAVLSSLTLDSPLAVAQGGTGAATLTSGYALLGNGTSAPQMINSTADSTMLVGNGSTMVAETGATLRTSIGVDAAGTDNSTNVTLAGTPNYLTLSGQEITLTKLDITDDTNLVAGTNITLATNTINVDDAFLINDGNDTTSGTITAAGLTTSGNISGSSTSTGSFGRLRISGNSHFGTGGDSVPYNSNSDTANFITLKGGSDTGHTAIIELASANVSTNNIVGEIHFVNRSSGADYNPVGNISYKYGGEAGFNFWTKYSSQDAKVGLRISEENGPPNVYIPSGSLIVDIGDVSGSSTSTGSFGHLVIAKDAHIGEDVLADGDVVAYNSSDIRLKDNIQVIQGSLDKIGDIRGVEFDWNDKSPGWARERGHDVGVIAQEVEKVLPEVVVKRKSGYLGVDYKRLVPLLIESVKELRQEVNDLKKKVN